MSKPGPKFKLDDAAKRRIYDMLKAGVSLVDAADIMGVAYSTIFNEKARDPEFCIGVKRAAKDGKLRLVKKVGKATSWQAAAWLLERRWGNDFGRKDRHEHTGKDGGPIQSNHKLDLSKLDETDLTTLRQLQAKALANN